MLGALCGFYSIARGQNMGKAGKNGLNQSYNGIARGAWQSGRQAAAGAERPRAGGSAGAGSPVCYILYEIYNKKTIYIFIIIYLPCL